MTDRSSVTTTVVVAVVVMGGMVPYERPNWHRHFPAVGGTLHDCDLIYPGWDLILPEDASPPANATPARPPTPEPEPEPEPGDNEQEDDEPAGEPAPSTPKV